MQNNTVAFEKAQDVQNIKETIKNIFDLDLEISGSWGYDEKSALKIKKLDSSIEQFMHTFAIMRANIEMNLMQEESNRYSGLNVHVEDIKEVLRDDTKYKIISFKVTATNAEENSNLIKEYKENYGKKEFDLQGHFQRRKDCEIHLTSKCWFDITEI